MRHLTVATLAALLILCLSAAFATAAQGATANETGYACQLVRARQISAPYGKGSRAEKRVVEVGEDSSEGKYTSGCRVKVTKRARHGAGRSTRREHLGQIELLTIVPAAGAAAGAWDPEKVNAGLLSDVEWFISNFGGEAFAMPTLGQSEAHAYWLGNKQISAEAFWRHADSGFLLIDLHDFTESPPRLERLMGLFAGGIVPRFSP